MADRYPRAVIALHWIGALFVFGLFGAGLVMTELAPEDPLRLWMGRAHSASGATLMLLTAIRLFARWRGPAVEPLPLTPTHARMVGALHTLLYAVVFTVGGTGMLTGATSAWPDYMGGLLPAAPDLHDMATREAHEALAFLLIALVIGHVGGVARQHLREGGVWERMAPWRR